MVRFVSDQWRLVEISVPIVFEDEDEAEACGITKRPQEEFCDNISVH